MKTNVNKTIIILFALLLSVCAYCENFSFAMLDVGQGLNIVVINDGKALIYDCGTSDFNNTNFEMNKYCFDNVTKPYLDKNNIKEIEYVVLSHPQTDHYIGFLNGLELFKVNNLFHNGRNSSNRNYKELVNLVSYKNIKCEQVFNGKKFRLGDAECEVLGPFANLDFKEPDENSVVLKITYNKKTFLLAGDISEKSEYYYVKNYGKALKSDVYVVAGHGTKYSSSQSFLDSVSPDYALISCGVNNQYHLPHPTLLKRLRNYNILGTYMNGNVVFKVVNDKIEVVKDK